MGRNKALLPLGDRMMVRRIVDAIAEIADEVVVVVSGRQDPEEYRRVLPPTVRLTADTAEQQSPVVGISSGLSALTSEYACVLSCDVPFVKPMVLDYLFKRAEGEDAAIPIWPDGLIEPLQAVYRVEPTRLAAKEAVEADELKNTDMIKRLERVKYVSVEELRAFDKELLSFFNVNTLDEYRTALSMLGEMGQEV